MADHRRSFAPRRLQDYLDAYGVGNVATDGEFMDRLVETFDMIRTIEEEIRAEGWADLGPEMLFLAAAVRMIGEVGAPPGGCRLWGTLYCNGDDHGDDIPYAHVTFQAASPKYIAAVDWVLREMIPESPWGIEPFYMSLEPEDTEFFTYELRGPKEATEELAFYLMLFGAAVNYYAPGDLRSGTGLASLKERSSHTIGDFRVGERVLMRGRAVGRDLERKLAEICVESDPDADHLWVPLNALGPAASTLAHAPEPAGDHSGPVVYVGTNVVEVDTAEELVRVRIGDGDGAVETMLKPWALFKLPSTDE
jgi:hypothetical protein